MLTTFPSLLVFGFFVPTLLRATLAAAFAYQAIGHFKNKKEVGEELDQKFSFISRESAVWLGGLLILAELAVGTLLFVGAWTQIAAILAALGFAKMAYFNDTLPTYAPLPRSTYFLLIVISIAVLVSGAGAFAFDLPL